MNALQTMVYRVLLIAGDRSMLDERLNIRLRVCDPVDTLTRELAACMTDTPKTLAILEEHQRTMPLPDEDEVFDRLWQCLRFNDPTITDRACLARIDGMLSAANVVNPRVRQLLHGYALMEEGLIAPAQLSHALSAYLLHHILPDLSNTEA